MENIQLIKLSEIRQHSMAIYDIAIASENSVYTASADQFVVRWNLKTGIQDAFTIQTDHPVYSIQLVDSNRISIGLNNGNLHIVDIKNKEELKFFTQHKSAIFRQLFLKEKKILITGDADGILSIWDTTSLKLQICIPLNCGKIRAIVSSEDETKLFIGGQDGVIRIIETNFFNEIHHFYAHQDGVSAIEIHPSHSNLIISGGKDGYLRVWDLHTHEKIKAIPAHNYAIYQISLHHGGEIMATCSRDKSIKIWDINSYKVLQKLDLKNGGHSHSVNRVQWIKDNLISCGDDRRLIEWKISKS